MEHVLVESAVRATLIAGGCAIVLRAARIKAPVVLHRVWAAVVVAMLILPVWKSWGPEARVAVLPQRAAALGSAAAFPLAVDPPRAIAESAMRTRSAPAAHAESGRPGWRAAALAIYGIVALILLARLGTGTLRARTLVKRSSMHDGHLTSAACTSPVTVGWLRPVVILPETWREWPAPKLDAVLTHEREHAQQRHPFVQWLALLNRALFWFHPLAWWLPGHLSVLAEQTCDDAVLARGHDPQAYSQYLIETAQTVGPAGRIQLAGVFMPGNQLSRRIRRILTETSAPVQSGSRCVAVAVACALACVTSVVVSPVRAMSQQTVTGGRAVIRPLQPRAIAPESPRPQPASLEWLEGDEWAFEIQSIASTEELAAYSRIANARERAAFIQRFWEARDPSIGTQENEFRDEYLRRVAFARTRFPTSSGMGFETDRGRMHLMFGAPDSIQTEAATFDRFEVWRYASIAGLGDNVRIRFSLSRDGYCGFNVVTPEPTRTAGVLRLYPLGLTAISIPVDAAAVVGVRYELRNRGGDDVDQGQIGFMDANTAKGPLGSHLPKDWFGAGFGCTHVLPPDTYTLATAVRLVTGELLRDSVLFEVE